MVEYHRTPLYFRNPFIHHGYRVHFSFLACIASSFYLHNETLNIWTAILPALWFLWQLYFFFNLSIFSFFSSFSFSSFSSFTSFSSFSSFSSFFTSLFHPISSAFFFDPLLISPADLLSALAIQMATLYALAFLAIAIFHTFHCMSNNAKKILAAMDYGAIALISYASFLPSVFLWLFWQMPDQYAHWASLNFFLSLGATVCCCFQYVRESRACRTLVFTSLATLPFIIVAFLQRAFPDRREVALLRAALVELGGTIVLGVVFFLGRIPERWMPGKCDIFFNSHHFWHLSFSIATARFWLETLSIFQPFVINSII